MVAAVDGDAIGGVAGEIATIGAGAFADDGIGAGSGVTLDEARASDVEAVGG